MSKMQRRVSLIRAFHVPCQRDVFQERCEYTMRPMWLRLQVGRRLRLAPKGKNVTKTWLCNRITEVLKYFIYTLLYPTMCFFFLFVCRYVFHSSSFSIIAKNQRNCCLSSIHARFATSSIQQI